MATKRGTAAALLRHLQQNPDQPHWVDDLMKTLDSSKVQIQMAANYLMKLEHPIEVVQPACCWVYRNKTANPQAASGRMFEEIGATKSGALVIQDESGNLYRATALD